MLTSLRGLAQSFVRGAVRLGRAASETFGTLVEQGLGYAKEQFDLDFEVYNRQKEYISRIKERDPDELIPGGLHEMSEWNLENKFKYDLQAVYENVWGKRVTKEWSAISNSRQTPNEIAATGASFAVESDPPEGYELIEAPYLTGVWMKEGALA